MDAKRRFPESTLWVTLGFLSVLALWAGAARASGSPKVFWLDPVRQNWVSLPCLNDRASLFVTGPKRGEGNALEWPALIRSTVQVHRLAEDALVEKTAVPLTANIESLPDGSFSVPRYQEASWRLTIRVTNTHDKDISSARVTDEFGAEFRVICEEPSRGSVSILRTDRPHKAHLRWQIGTLHPGETAELRCTVTTRLNPAGRQEFTRAGTHELNSGACLVYRLMGALKTARSGGLKVIAVDQAVPCDRSMVVQAITLPKMAARSPGNTMFQSQGEKDRSDLPVALLEEFQPITSSIGLAPAKDGYAAGFEAPEGTCLEWRVILTVRNGLPADITDLTVTEHFGAELEYDPAIVQVTPALRDQAPSGAPYSDHSFQRHGNLKLEWKVTRLAPEAEARLSFVVRTRKLENGQQLYGEPTPPDGPPYFLNSGATLKFFYLGKQESTDLDEVPVWITEGGYMRITFNATQYDWKIRRPGDFAAEPIEFSVASNRQVAVTFSQFGDLESVSGKGRPIPTFYGLGPTLADVDRDGWLRACDLNARRLMTSEAQVGQTARWLLWPRLEVAVDTRATEYRNVGRVTFTMLDVEPAIVGP